MNYTKGRWKVGEPFNKSGDNIPIYGEDDYELARVFIHNGEQFANAHLIAAAPDMYEALKALLRNTSNWTGTGKYQDILLELVDIKEALAKVERKNDYLQR